MFVICERNCLKSELISCTLSYEKNFSLLFIDSTYIPSTVNNNKISAYHMLDIVRIVIVEEEIITATSSWAIATVGSYCVCAKSLESCPTLCDPTDCSPPGSSVHGILQGRVVEQVAMSSCRGSS